ncbi:hypothetical protein CORC01_07321, partial [Colletotrichum orchidophilum]
SVAALSHLTRLLSGPTVAGSHCSQSSVPWSAPSMHFLRGFAVYLAFEVRKPAAVLAEKICPGKSKGTIIMSGR